MNPQLPASANEHLAFAVGGAAPPNPLMLVPEALRKPLAFFWICFSKLFPSIMPVAALLLTWRRSGELTDEQVIDILRDLTRPEAVSEFRYPSDLQCELAARVTRAIRKTRSARRQAEARRDREAWLKKLEQPEEVARIDEAMERLKRVQAGEWEAAKQETQ